MIDIIENISDIKNLKRNYQLDKPKGVKGRSSNNDLVKKVLKWSFKIKLKDGLKKLMTGLIMKLTKRAQT